jgi:hypothetical protein
MLGTEPDALSLVDDSDVWSRFWAGHRIPGKNERGREVHFLVARIERPAQFFAEFIVRMPLEKRPQILAMPLRRLKSRIGAIPNVAIRPDRARPPQ